MPRARPLDVDSGLPLPEVGQASTVFSLTALFGAYLGIHLLLGVPALLGLATGTVLALFLIRSWIEKTGADTFDSFLYSFLGTKKGNSTVLAVVLSMIQCSYAASELLILKDVADLSLGVRYDHATLMVVALGVIAYFYVLIGGYIAVFRTDVLQFILVSLMCLIAAMLAIRDGTVSGSTSTLLLGPRPGYWNLPLASPRVLLYSYHFVLGSVMGLGFLLASPDAWKRVFLVSSARKTRRTRFAIFATVGAAPFLLLIPIGAWSRQIPDGAISVDQIWSGVIASTALFVATALGLISSFLSAFNGALLSSVHVGLVARRHLGEVPSELPRFHWLMVSALLTIFFLFAAMLTFGNPYILANFLMGPYASIAGLLVATRGTIERMPDQSLIWILTAGCAAWFVYVVGAVGIPAVPTTYQVNTVPGGVLLFALTAVACKAQIAIGARRARFRNS